MAVKQRFFTAGREEEEIRAFWQAAHQKVLLDERWLRGVLSSQHPHLLLMVPGSGEAAVSSEQDMISPAVDESRIDWSDALAVPSFYGRERELSTLSRWLVQEHCRVVSVLGIGGIGKSALAVRLMQQVAPHFEVVLWRSLRDAPSCETFLDDCLQVLASQVLRDGMKSLESRFVLLRECMRRNRVLLVLDNLETVLEEGEDIGSPRSGFEDYARLLRHLAQTEHQSCLLLTSREQPAELVPLEGSRAPVRALRLTQLYAPTCQQLLAEKEVQGSTIDYARLIEAYAGNPLALNIVAQTIVDLFDGEIALFLE